MRSDKLALVCMLALTLLIATAACHAPPIGPAPSDRAAARALPAGPLLVVDASRGSDTHDGSIAQPLRTIAAALDLATPGVTIILRQGIYYENVTLALAGTEDKPITIRSHPGEQAILDGSIPLFLQSPEKAWQPAADGESDEFVSAQTFHNLSHPIGSIMQNMVGLQTYYHHEDLIASQERIDYADFKQQRQTDHAPLYCGPGVWHNTATGRIHIRLTKTNLDHITNYDGPADPRSIPIILAANHSVPLRITGAQHITLHDITIRGGGYDTVIVSSANHITFDHVTIHAGTYGLRVQSTQHLLFKHSAIHGNIPPWSFRSDTRKRDYPGRPQRNITRLNTHALLVTDNGREHDVYATPVNDHWEISHSTFTNAHDGLYIGGININFHHNHLKNMQDDGLYLSEIYPRSLFTQTWPTADIHQNIFEQINMPLAFGAEYVSAENKSIIYIHHNVFDQRLPLLFNRPTTQSPETKLSWGVIIGDHGSPAWAAMNIYHNTFLAGGPQRDVFMGVANGLSKDRPRNILNNIFIHAHTIPPFPMLDPAKGIYTNGNLYWSMNAGKTSVDNFFSRFRKSPLFEASKQQQRSAMTSQSVFADPMLETLSSDPAVELNWQPRAGSPAINAGVTIPADWPHPMREVDAGKPDIGAVPAGTK